MCWVFLNWFAYFMQRFSSMFWSISLQKVSRAKQAVLSWKYCLLFVIWSSINGKMFSGMLSVPLDWRVYCLKLTWILWSWKQLSSKKKNPDFYLLFFLSIRNWAIRYKSAPCTLSDSSVIQLPPLPTTYLTPPPQKKRKSLVLDWKKDIFFGTFSSHVEFVKVWECWERDHLVLQVNNCWRETANNADMHHKMFSLDFSPECSTLFSSLQTIFFCHIHLSRSAHYIWYYGLGCSYCTVVSILSYLN